MNKKQLSAVICLMSTLGAAGAQAQVEAASVKLGSGIEFTPSLKMGFRHDDNITRAESDEQDSPIAVINPNFLLSADNGVSSYRLNYSLARGEYFESEADNYTDHAVSGGAAWELNDRNKLELDASITDGHEARGSGFSEGSGSNLAEPDRYIRNDVSGKYTFGAKSAKGQLSLLLGADDKDYEGGVRTAGRDFGSEYGAVAFRYNSGSRTKLLAEIHRRDIGYDYVAVGRNSLDSSEMRYQVGVSWEGTAKTTGTVKVGGRTKEFDSPAREDFTGPSWEVGVRWTPKTYSAFDFNTARRSVETNGVGDFIDTTTYTLGWSHTWADRLSSQAAYDYSINDYQGEGVDREDDVSTFGLQFNYQMRRWLAFNAGFSIADKDSNTAGFAYERNVTFVGLQASL